MSLNGLLIDLVSAESVNLRDDKFRSQSDE